MTPLERMIGRRGLLGLGGLFAVGSLAGLAGRAAASPDPDGVTRTIIATAPLDDGWELKLLLGSCPPGMGSAPHRHPSPGLNYILEGQVESQYEGEPVRTFRAGDSFQDQGGPAHLMFRNPDPVATLRWLVFFRVRPGERFVTPL